MSTEYRYYHRRGPSFFFPFALITVGVVWLLVTNGTIPMENVYRLIPFWPVLIILAGISLLIRRIHWSLNALLWGGAAVLLVLALISPPAFLPQAPTVELQHQVLSEPIEQAKSAQVQLDLSINHSDVHALTDTQNLLVADMYVVSPRNLDASGNAIKNVHLRDGAETININNWWRFDQLFQESTRAWDIGLTPQIPLQLRVDASTGSSNLDLTGLKLETLRVEGSTGSMKIRLPESQSPLPFTVNASTGSTTINMPANTPVDLTADGSTGSLTIILPPGAGVQVIVADDGLGGMTLAPDFKKVSGPANGKEGVWENAAFAASQTPITIRLNIGTGGIDIR